MNLKKTNTLLESVKRELHEGIRPGSDFDAALSALDDAEEGIRDVLESLKEVYRSVPGLKPVMAAYIIPHLEGWIAGRHQTGNIDDLRQRIESMADEADDDESEED